MLHAASAGYGQVSEPTRDVNDMSWDRYHSDGTSEADADLYGRGQSTSSGGLRWGGLGSIWDSCTMGRLGLACVKLLGMRNRSIRVVDNRAEWCARWCAQWCAGVSASRGVFGGH